MMAQTTRSVVTITSLSLTPAGEHRDRLPAVSTDAIRYGQAEAGNNHSGFRVTGLDDGMAGRPLVTGCWRERCAPRTSAWVTVWFCARPPAPAT